MWVEYLPHALVMVRVVGFVPTPECVGPIAVSCHCRVFSLLRCASLCITSFYHCDCTSLWRLGMTSCTLDWRMLSIWFLMA